MPTLYLDGRLVIAGFAKATKTCPAHKLYWRPLNWKRSLAVLKWTSESEYFLSFENFFADTYNNTMYRGLQVAWHKNRDEIGACAKFGGNFELKFCACADFVAIFVPSNLTSPRAIT